MQYRLRDVPHHNFFCDVTEMMIPGRGYSPVRAGTWFGTRVWGYMVGVEGEEDRTWG